MPTTELTLQDPTSFPIISTQQQQQQQSSIITNFHTNTSNNTNSNGIISNSKPFVNLFNTASKGHAMIRHSSLEANSHPGLSFFCKNDNTFKENTKREKVFEKSLHVQSTTTHAPLVISRLNISHRNNTMATTTAAATTTTTAAMNKNGLTDLDDEEDTIDTPPTSPTTNANTINTKPVNQHHTFFNFTSSFKPGFGSVGTFMLRGSSNNGSNNNNNNNNNNNRHQLDEARVNRKIEDLEIEKKSLLTLNQTLESVVKQQSNTIQDLQSRLAAVEGPLKPGLSNSLNVKGVMSTSSVESADDNEELEDDDAAFERIRNMLLLLIEQAQSAVLEREDEVLGIRVITGGEDQYQQQGMTRKNQRPRSMDGRSTNKIIPATVGNNKILSRRQSLTSIQEQQQQQQSKRRSLQVTTPTSPIPNRRLSLQKSVSRSSSPAVLFSEDSRCPSPTPSVRSTTNKKKLNSNKQQQQQQQQQTVRKWQN